MIDLMELTAEDLADIEVLQKFRKESEKLYRAVVNNQRVPLILDEMNRYKLWDDSNNAEYLTLKDGEWFGKHDIYIRVMMCLSIKRKYIG